MNAKLLIAAGMVASLSNVASASAGWVTLYDNLGETTAGGTPLISGPSGSFSTGKASVGSIFGYVLLTSYGDDGEFTVSLNSDKGSTIDYQENYLSSYSGPYFFSFNDILTPETHYSIGVAGPVPATWDYAASGYRMQVFGYVAAPEPSTWAMMLAGLGALGLAASRRPAKLAPVANAA